MQLKIRFHPQNNYPFCGFLIQGNKLENWLIQLQSLNIDLVRTPVYAIPDNTPNSIWGCFVHISDENISRQLTVQQACHSISNHLFIPSHSIISPLLSKNELAKNFSMYPHILHNDFGLFALEEPINWGASLTIPEIKLLKISKPSESSFIPEKIKRLEIKALPPDEFLRVMEENVFPKKESFKDERLNWKEKIKLPVLRTLLTSKSKGNVHDNREISHLNKMISKLFPEQKWMEKLENDLKDLERRNSTELEKLMMLFKSDPMEALKYAIPLDNDGITRGGNQGSFSMSKRWNSLNIFGSSSPYSNGGSAVFADDSFYKLQIQYQKTAEKLIQDKEYSNAAFVYMKLLKNNQKAAETLETGKLYSEAASVYLKYLQNKSKAAECYEKGHMTTDAIQLYKELKQYEKVGDLYITQHNREMAYEYYNMVIDEYKIKNNFVKASLLYRKKMNDYESAQDLLLEGWRNNYDAFNCLNNYFANIEDLNLLVREIENIYAKETSPAHKDNFLKVLKYEYRKDKSIEERIREMAYELVSDLAAKTPEIVMELKNFNNDISLGRDILRFKTRKK